eukprot:1196840-Rhodomonas_salina.1
MAGTVLAPRRSRPDTLECRREGCRLGEWEPKVCTRQTRRSAARTLLMYNSISVRWKAAAAALRGAAQGQKRTGILLVSSCWAGESVDQKSNCKKNVRREESAARKPLLRSTPFL